MFGELAKAMYESQVESDQLELMTEAAGDVIGNDVEDIDMDDLDSILNGDPLSDEEMTELDQAIDQIIQGDKDLGAMTREQIEDTIADV